MVLGQLALLVAGIALAFAAGLNLGLQIAWKYRSMWQRAMVLARRSRTE